MNLLKRSTIVAAVLAGALASAATPASAIVGGHDATQAYPGMAAMSVLLPGLGTLTCGSTLLHPSLASSIRDGYTGINRYRRRIHLHVSR
jgi:hypothetical protein